MTYPLDIGTGVGGAIAVSTIVSDTVRTYPATEWSSIANAYNEFRVLGVRLQLTGVQNPTSQTSIVISAWRGGVGPSTYPGVVAQTGSKIFNLSIQGRPISFGCDCRGFENALLWANTGTGIASVNSLGLAYGSDILGPVSTTVATGFVEWVVQFRFAQA